MFNMSIMLASEKKSQEPIGRVEWTHEKTRACLGGRVGAHGLFF
jgi:hypothetical protein